MTPELDIALRSKLQKAIGTLLAPEDTAGALAAAATELMGPLRDARYLSSSRVGEYYTRFLSAMSGSDGATFGTLAGKLAREERLGLAVALVEIHMFLRSAAKGGEDD